MQMEREGRDKESNKKTEKERNDIVMYYHHNYSFNHTLACDKE